MTFVGFKTKIYKQSAWYYNRQAQYQCIPYTHLTIIIIVWAKLGKILRNIVNFGDFSEFDCNSVRERGATPTSCGRLGIIKDKSRTLKGINVIDLYAL